jgi:EAL domain-containing protein (putative c-di-GMP-specific phosphodiesterase class I)
LWRALRSPILGVVKTWELRGVTVDVTGAPVGSFARESRGTEGSAPPDAEFVRLLAEVAGSELERADRDTARRRARIRRIRDVIGRGRLTVVLQPIREVRSLSTVGFEALGRIRGLPCQGPSWWLQEAQAVGLRTELELAATRTAVATLDVIRPPAELWLNASPGTILSGSFARAIAAGDPSRTVVELTEQAVVDDYDRLRDAVARLRALGARLAVDDVGAGASTFRHILDLAPDVIKLDMSLIRRIEADAVRRALVVAMVEFARDVGAQLTAEGVESEAQLRTLRRLGVRFGQGFHLGRPVSPSALAGSPGRRRIG